MSAAEPWREAMGRAYRASAESRAEAEKRAGQVYRFEVGFTVPASIARDLRCEVVSDDAGSRFEIEFYGTEDARRKITDVIAALPTTCRSFRRHYATGKGATADG